MSKAETLGASSAFASAAGAISARRMVTQQAFGQSTAGPVTEVPVTDISLNPANPRSELGNLTQLAGSLKDHGQKTAISIMSREAYLAAHPGHVDKLEAGTRYVAVDGNSRLAAAREAGLKTLKVMADDDLGKDADDLLESSLVANIHRRELDHLDEARALERLLTIHGTQEALAARLHRSQGWVSQRLSLLKLTPELQERLERGKEPADLLRRVGNKKPEEQAAHLERLKQERKAKQRANVAKEKPAPAVTRHPHAGVVDVARSGEDGGYYDVMEERRQQEPAPVSRDEPSAPPAVAPPGRVADKADAPVPALRHTKGEDQSDLPWDDVEALADIIFSRLSKEHRLELTMVLQRKNREAAHAAAGS
ncbi:ParB/RepB/Spo0J family partition protein [Streptomyces lavendofoliae]|uniref:Plasmid partitioning protein n=2 Tax=Streptomyces TaxID=1883 RepID=A0A918I317_9ACTN|nr:ParB/RepB/Spo0J family partition protein [Streptomyces lavendofoliae]GGU62031.1 plasmid partitioning protein [Streptomyces lavendofoliae]